MVVGSVELVPLVDAVGELGELAELFPDTADWEPCRDLYPEIFAESRWRIPCTSYLLRSAGETVLVDTGVGPAGLWGWDAEFEEGLLPALEEAGAAAEDVDVVFFTHLHVDHVGWNTDRDGVLVFPNARYVAHRDGVAFAGNSGRPHVERTILSVDSKRSTAGWSSPRGHGLPAAGRDSSAASRRSLARQPRGEARLGLRETTWTARGDAAARRARRLRLATGETHSVRASSREAFGYAGLELARLRPIDERYFRPPRSTC